MADEMNKLYYGDNLDVLRRYIPDQSVDLVYLDPPFNSGEEYKLSSVDSGRTQCTAPAIREYKWPINGAGPLERH